MAYAAVGALYATFLAVGWLAARRLKGATSADLILAGRSMPLWLATLTMTATWVDGGYLLGTAEAAYKSGIALALQGGVCFGISLILGGLFFARTMRRYEFTTLIDPFEARFGRRWAVVLFVPALLGEVFWSAELLAAIGSTFGVLLGMQLAAAIVISAVIVTLYTLAGGMWSVAYTDVVQLALVAAGTVAAIPVMTNAAGGLAGVFAAYAAAGPGRAVLLPPLRDTAWWDISAMLIFGGIPWNCYFQRVLSCQTPRRAQAHSILAGLLTIGFTIPPLILGAAAVGYHWPTNLLAQLQEQPSRALPMIFQYVTPPLISVLGLGAIVGAVTSSFSASILSAGSMFAWNCCHRLLTPNLSNPQIARLIRVSILLLGAAATIMALKVESVQALWFFTSDLIFVLLFPQLIFALFDPKANRTGSMVAFGTAAILRLGAGEPLLGLPAFISYPESFPFRTVSAIAGLILLPAVSRITAKYDAPRRLRNSETAAA